jgi:peptidoglycan/LPS O-acetylase OafA/YrhL
VRAFPLNVLLAAAAAVLSYFLVERTFLRLRAHRSRVAPAPPARAASGSL